MWSIACIDNDVKISNKLAKSLFGELGGECEGLWYALEDVTYNGKLYFESDHMEHMDYLWREEVQKLLKEAKVKGRITFGSLDGDNSGQFWGYEFDGKGNMTRLKGTLSWEEAPPEPLYEDDEEEYDEE